MDQSDEHLTLGRLVAECDRRGDDTWLAEYFPSGSWPGRATVDLDNVGDPGFWLEDFFGGDELDVLTDSSGDESLAEDMAQEYISTHEGYWGESYRDYCESDREYAQFVAGIEREFVAFIVEWLNQVLLAMEESHTRLHGSQDNAGEELGRKELLNNEDKPIPEDEYELDYPEENDYVDGPEDSEGLARYLEDVARWGENLPLKGGKKAARSAEQNGDIETPDEQKEPGVVSLRHDALRRVNFASAQNDVAIIREITVENPTNETLNDIRITLRASPPIIREKTWTIDRVAPGSDFPVSDKSTLLDIERLKGLNEAEIGELEFRMEAQGLQTIVEKRRIELLARDEWGGVHDMAQILAAFVSPNDPAIARVIKDAARLLEGAGHDGSMDGYQSVNRP